MNNTHPNMFDYLDAQGVLENGTDEDIKAAKRAYKKLYFKRYRKERRAEQPEFSIGFSRKSGDYGKITLAAKRHSMTVTRFIREATLAYLDRRFLTLLPHRIAEVMQLLMDCRNDVKAISQMKERSSYDREQKYQAISDRIALLEGQLQRYLHYPELLEEAVSHATTTDPALRGKLLAVLSNDNQDQIA